MSTEQPNPYEAPVTVDDPLVDPDQFYDGRLRTAAIGLKLIYVGILLVFITWIGAIPFSMLGVGISIIGGILSIAPLLGMLMICIGPMICLTVPSGIGLRSIVVASVLAQVSAIVVCVVAAIPSQTTSFVAFASLILVLLAWFLFLGFLYRLASRIERDDLVRRARNVLILGSVVLFVLTPVMWLTDLDLYDIAGPIYYLILVLSVLVCLVMYANLVNALSNAIRHPRMKRPLVGIA